MSCNFRENDSQTTRWIWVLCGALALMGCSSKPSDQPDLGTVTGVITLDGKPLALADVLFQPAEGRPSTGKTDEAGHYALTYSQHAAGAKIGPHTVHITTYRPNVDPNDTNTPEYPEQLPAKYHSKSTLTADVKPGKNEFNFDLQSK